MADIEHYIPFCIKHEAHVNAKKATETNVQYFERARKGGYVVDSGGPTLTGLTLTIYKKYKPNATIALLKAISYNDWKYCMKKYFWDKIKADQIKSQSVAEAIMDWYWNSGASGVKNVQRLLGVTADGIIGSQTIAAINKKDPYELWSRILSKRYDYFQSLVKSNPDKYKKYLGGWINRLNEFVYEEDF